MDAHTPPVRKDRIDALGATLLVSFSALLGDLVTLLGASFWAGIAIVAALVLVGFGIWLVNRRPRAR